MIPCSRPPGDLRRLAGLPGGREGGDGFALAPPAEAQGHPVGVEDGCEVGLWGGLNGPAGQPFPSPTPPPAAAAAFKGCRRALCRGCASHPPGTLGGAGRGGEGGREGTVHPCVSPLPARSSLPFRTPAVAVAVPLSPPSPVFSSPVRARCTAAGFRGGTSPPYFCGGAFPPHALPRSGSENSGGRVEGERTGIPGYHTGGVHTPAPPRRRRRVAPAAASSGSKSGHPDARQHAAAAAPHHSAACQPSTRYL